MKICNTLLAYPPLSEWDSPPFGGVGGGFLSFRRLLGEAFFHFLLLHRYTLHFYISHVNKGVKIVEFKGKKHNKTKSNKM